MCPFRSLSLGAISLVLAVAVAAAASSLPTYHGLSKRVVGGSKAQSTDYPFAVFISSPDVTNSTACAGAILTDQIIVTSAYCVYDPAAKQAVSEGNIRVGFGNSNLGSQALVPVKKIIVDSTYTPATGVDDIALLQVNLTQYISDKVNRVPLYIGTLQSGDSLTFMGWGSTNAYSGATSNDLNYAKVIVGDDATCKNATSPYTNTNGRAICTLNKLTPNVSPCLGDYGGPLITYDNNIPKLVGVFSSFVTMGGKLDRCANSNTMALYTHVYSYISFLKAKTGLSDDAFTGNTLLVPPASGTTPTPGPTETIVSPPKSLSTGAIAGIAVGAVVAIVLIALLGYFLYRSIKRQKENKRSEYIYELGLQQLAEELGGSYEPKRSTTVSILNSSTITPYEDGLVGRPSFTSRYLRTSTYDDGSEAPFSENIPHLAEMGTEISMDTLSKTHRYADGSPMVMEFIRPSREGRVSDYYPYLEDYLYDYSDNRSDLITL